MFRHLDENQFKLLLAEHFTPAQPIQKSEHLFGRERKVRDIERALASPGKHVFIFGDRGVGKTSLARTVAGQRLGAPDKVPFVSCDQGASFFETMENIRRELLRANPQLLGNMKVEAEIDLKLFKLKGAKQLHGSEAATESVHAVADTFRALTASGDETLVIVDEFDQLPSDTDKKYFADLLKQLSDRGIPLRLMICGIGRALEDLIGVHLSTDRYLAPIALDPIPHDARWAILTNAASAFNVEIDRDAVIRVGQISDGFPYYVHLMGEKIFWAAFDRNEDIRRIDASIYGEGVKSAIEEAQTSLRKTYDVATQKHKNSDDYEHALWAVADGPMLKKQVTEIYQQSYLRIIKELGLEQLQLPGENAEPDVISRFPLTKEAFYQRLNKLKKSAHGEILVANKLGWYEFKENMVRGYVRLRAERGGVQIGLDHIKG